MSESFKKTLFEILALAVIVTGAGLIWALNPDPSVKPPVATTGIADLGSGAQSSPTGLRWKDLEVGTGPSPKPGQTAIVHYTGRLPDGGIFDASRDHGNVFKFKLGAGEVIKGWDEGVATMKVGGVRRLVVPPDLGYGASGSGKIPPYATLVFDIELLGVE